MTKSFILLLSIILLHTATSLLSNVFLRDQQKRYAVARMGVQIEELPLPKEICREEGIEDIVFVERLPEVQSTGGGLFLPGKTDSPQHVARVISVGPGRNEQSGFVTPCAVSRRALHLFFKSRVTRYTPFL